MIHFAKCPSAKRQYLFSYIIFLIEYNLLLLTNNYWMTFIAISRIIKTNKILKSDWFNRPILSNNNKVSNNKIRRGARTFFGTLLLVTAYSSITDPKTYHSEMAFSQWTSSFSLILLKLWLIGNRSQCSSILSVIRTFLGLNKPGFCFAVWFS